MAKKKRALKKKKIIKRKANKTARAKTPKVKRMSKSDLKKYKALLLKERERMSGELSHITEDTLKKSQRDASGDLSGYSFHMADMASDDYDREFSLGRATDEQKTIYKIDEALKRIEDATYGACLQCGKMIAKKRLKALSYADVCIECQRKNDV